MSQQTRLSAAVADYQPTATPLTADGVRRCRLGILPGEGIGPEIIDITLGLLRRLERYLPIQFEVAYGGAIGKLAVAQHGASLTPEVIDFCAETFAAGGVVIAGPGGARFVYDLRQQFDLYCKLVPLQPLPALADCGVLRPSAVADVDVVVVRENVSGLYVGESTLSGAPGDRRVETRFHYREAEIARIVAVAATAARQRRGRLCVVTKPGATRRVADLWQQVAREVVAAQDAAAGGTPLQLAFLEIDNACYQLVAAAAQFDVVVTSNMFGDVLADGATLLLGSRGVSWSANYGPGERAVYQTGHGAAYDLVDQDCANPLGQMMAAVMMLRESFDAPAAADALWQAINATLAEGWRTADIMAPGCQMVGSRALGERIGDRLEQQLRAAVSAA